MPLIGISILEKGKLQLYEEQVWDDAKILNSIVEESDVIIFEAERQNIYKK